MNRLIVAALALLAATDSYAQAPDPAGSPQARGSRSGIFSHGDSGDFVEEAFGGVAEPRREENMATRKHDPALRWDLPASGR